MKVQCKECGIEYECQQGTEAHRNLICHRCKFKTRAPVILTKKQYTHVEVGKILHDHNVPFEFDDSKEAKKIAEEWNNVTKRYHRLEGK